MSCGFDHLYFPRMASMV